MQNLLDRNLFPTQQPSALLGGGEADNLARAQAFRAGASETFASLGQDLARFGNAEGQTRPQARPVDDPSLGQNASNNSLSGSLSQFGFNDNVPGSLIQSESGGNFGAENDAVGSGGKKGHFGILQFGQDRLTDAKRAGAIPSNMTPQEFQRDEQAQVSAANWHFSDIDNRIKQNGFDRLVGQNIGGTPMTMNGMRAMAHLGGFGGLSSFIASGGQRNPSDVNGTSLADYGRLHSR